MKNITVTHQQKDQHPRRGKKNSDFHAYTYGIRHLMKVAFMQKLTYTWDLLNFWPYHYVISTDLITPTYISISISRV